MDIGLVWVLVDELGMHVHMGVFPGCGERGVFSGVGMVVVEVIMAVAVLMDEWWVPVGMGVLLCDQQPCAEYHDRERGIEDAARHLSKDCEREENAEKRGYGKERTCPSGANTPEGEEEENTRRPPKNP